MDILFYALLAVFLGWRLYSILGQRHEGERQRPNPLQPPPQQPDDKTKKDDLFALPLPPSARKDAARDDEESEGAETALPPLYAEPAPLSLAGGLHAIRKADPSFDEKSFLKGARAAFDMIVKAFAAADRATLKNLLSTGLYATFAKELDARETRGERHEMRTLIVRDADIIAARLDGRDAVVTVQFASEQARAIFDKDGGIIADPGRAVESLTDVWTFRRNTALSDPNWKLVDTRAV